MASRRDRRAGGRRAKRRGAPAAPPREGFLSRRSPDWIVGGIIVGVVLIAAAIFISRQVIGRGGGSIPFGEISAVYSLAVSPSDPQTLFLGEGKGLYRSTDGGRKWGRLEVRDEVRKVQIDAANPNVLMVAAGTSLRKSGDGGATWQTLTTDLPAGSLGALASDPADPSKMYAYVGGQGLFRSNDGGATWTKQNPIAEAQITSLAVKAGAPDTLYAFSTLDGFVTSGDGGKGFQNIDGGIPRKRVSDVVTFAEQLETLFAAAGAGVYRSADGGRTWKPLTSGLEEVDIRALSRNPRSGYLYAADLRGVVYVSTTGGESWAQYAL